MKLNQKVRVMRKFANQLIDEHEFHSWEISAFGAPGEVWDLIAKNTHKRVKQLMDQLELTKEDFEKEIDRQIAVEAEHINAPEVGDWFDPDPIPEAYHEAIMILEHA